MASRPTRRAAWTSPAVAAVPGATTAPTHSPSVVAATSPFDPSVVATAPPLARAIGSVVLVSLFGGALLLRHRAFVDDAIDATMDRPAVSVVYGLLAYVVVGFFGTYAYTLLAGTGVGGTVVPAVGLVVGAVVVSTLAGLGYLVVGTVVTDVYAVRRHWQGLLFGAGISALGWLILPFLGGLLVWVAVSAFGIGGSVREWFHASRATDVPETG